MIKSEEVLGNIIKFMLMQSEEGKVLSEGSYVSVKDLRKMVDDSIDNEKFMSEYGISVSLKEKIGSHLTLEVLMC